MKFPSFKAKKSSIGIDIGTSSIKIVELSRNRKEKTHLKNYGFLESYGYSERFNNPFQTSSLKMLDNEVAEIIRDIIEEAKIANRRAAMSIPVFSSFFTAIDFPRMSMNEIKKSVPYQARQYIPIPISEVFLDWRIVPQNSRTGDSVVTDKIQVLLTAVPREVIAKYQRIAKLAGIQLTFLEIENFSVTRSILFQDFSPTLVLDIGARSTNISVVDKGQIIISHNLDTSGDELTETISKTLAINPKRAEEIKRSIGLKGRGGEVEISDALLLVLDLIYFEVEKIVSLYRKKEKERRIRKLILAGGSANLTGLADYFVRKLQIEVGVGNPFVKLEFPSILQPVLKEMGPGFAVSVGLAMREL